MCAEQPYYCKQSHDIPSKMEYCGERHGCFNTNTIAVRDPVCLSRLECPECPSQFGSLSGPADKRRNAKKQYIRAAQKVIEQYDWPSEEDADAFAVEWLRQALKNFDSRLAKHPGEKVPAMRQTDRDQIFENAKRQFANESLPEVLRYTRAPPAGQGANVGRRVGAVVNPRHLPFLEYYEAGYDDPGGSGIEGMSSSSSSKSPSSADRSKGKGKGKGKAAQTNRSPTPASEEDLEYHEGDHLTREAERTERGQKVAQRRAQAEAVEERRKAEQGRVQLQQPLQLTQQTRHIQGDGVRQNYVFPERYVSPESDLQVSPPVTKAAPLITPKPPATRGTTVAAGKQRAVETHTTQPRKSMTPAPSRATSSVTAGVIASRTMGTSHASQPRPPTNVTSMPTRPAAGTATAGAAKRTTAGRSTIGKTTGTPAKRGTGSTSSSSKAKNDKQDPKKDATKKPGLSRKPGA
ncbi:uncharacterized protein ALTATR162_LOCUS2842 [Alternaria atra]|uniref:Uncharacterized protein n=1 Tax=Alternaria atra TaxID=119953 RepID=A0A8J2HZ86_9PLEO|nr:uncharacterized protein ALTATR162_LOCUS2842 [Alternaria atra]CAG5152610.1 unnamed protein product [Alternaria atra]